MTNDEKNMMGTKKPIIVFLVHMTFKLQLNIDLKMVILFVN